MVQEYFDEEGEEFSEDPNDEGNSELPLATFSEFKQVILDDLAKFEKEVAEKPEDFPSMNIGNWFENFAVSAGWM